MVNPYQIFEQVTKPWPGCGFLSKKTSLKVRRIIERDEVQIEVEIRHVRPFGKSSRGHAESSSFVLNSADAERFASAVLGTEPVGAVEGEKGK